MFKYIFLILLLCRVFFSKLSCVEVAFLGVLWAEELSPGIIWGRDYVFH